MGDNNSTKMDLHQETVRLQQELKEARSTLADIMTSHKGLEESIRLLRTVFASLEQGITVMDREWTVLFANPAMERFFPPYRRPVIGRKCYEVFHGRDQVCEDCPCLETQRSGVPQDAVIAQPDGQGGIRAWFRHTSFPLRDPETERLFGVIECIQDISVHERAEEALQTTQDQLRALFENLVDGYYEVNLRGDLVFFNEPLARIFGYPPEDLLGMNNREYTDAENAAKMYQAFNGVYRTGEPVRGLRFEVITKEKERRFLEVSIALKKDPRGDPVGFRGIARDITDLIRVQEALRLSEERYRNIIETINDPYYEVDLRGNLTFFNEAFLNQFDLPREELLGLNYREYTDEKNAQKLFAAFNRVYRTGQPARGIRHEVIFRDRRKGVYEASVAPIRDASGTITGFRGISRNISDLIEMQQALQASEERYRTIVETMREGYYENDLAGNLTFLNQAMADFLGYSKEEMIGMNYRDYTPDESRQAVFEVFNELYRTGQSKTIRYEMRNKEGETRVIETTPVIIRNQSGEPIGFRGTSRDITDLIRTQNDLRASEERYRKIIEEIVEGYYEVDLAGNFTFINDSMVRIMGYPKTELLGMNNRTYTAPEYHKIVFEAFNRIYRTDEPIRRIQYEIRTKEGERKQVEASASLIRDPSGKPIGFRGIVRDITELVRAQQARRATEERFRIAAECASDMIYEVDTATGALFWFGDSIHKLERMIGEIPSTVAQFEKHVHPEDNPKRVEAVRLHLKGQRPYRQEYRLIGKNGEIFHVRGAAQGLRDEKGRVYRWIGAFSDITEQKKREEELRESLNQLHKAMGGIIRAMAVTVESRDPYTAGHQQRVSNLGRSIAQEMGLSKERVEAVRMAGIVHDLGKISIPAEILSKPTALSDLEFKLIQAHPQTSYDILKDIDFPWPVGRIVLQHHERLDGSGYPFGLKGDQILVEAQVLMVADVVEAIASHRPYRPAYGIQAALEEIEKNKGTKYNIRAVEACLRLFREKGFSFDEPFNQKQRG